MLATFILTVCLASNPFSCSDERPALQLTLMECMLQGQQIAAQWLEDHPKYQLRRYRCELGNRGRET